MNEPKAIKLVGGPYNGRVIADCGAVVIKMCIYDGPPRKGVRCGVAHYEPNEDRTMAFFLTNEWDGILEEEGRLDLFWD
jgi:crotonobetainyl-CoA:carnitine CoA-transferase CaiB-like acyl-CoA transferase